MGWTEQDNPLKKKKYLKIILLLMIFISINCSKTKLLKPPFDPSKTLMRLMAELKKIHYKIAESPLMLIDLGRVPLKPTLFHDKYIRSDGIEVKKILSVEKYVNAKSLKAYSGLLSNIANSIGSILVNYAYKLEDENIYLGNLMSKTYKNPIYTLKPSKRENIITSYYFFDTVIIDPGKRISKINIGDSNIIGINTVVKKQGGKLIIHNFKIGYKTIKEKKMTMLKKFISNNKTKIMLNALTLACLTGIQYYDNKKEAEAIKEEYQNISKGTDRFKIEELKAEYKESKEQEKLYKNLTYFFGFVGATPLISYRYKW